MKERKGGKKEKEREERKGGGIKIKQQKPSTYSNAINIRVERSQFLQQDTVSLKTIHQQ